MSGAFHQAWAVLKEDFLGSGAWRKVSRGVDPNLAYKQPHSPSVAMNPMPIAAGQALAQMGYPFAPETPIAPPTDDYWQRTMTTQPLAQGGDLRNPKDADDYTSEKRMLERDRFLEQMGMKDWTQDPREPLLHRLGVWDVGRRNVGLYDDGPKVIDFGVDINSREPVDSGHPWALRAIEWGDVPKEKRQTFTNLYSDRSMFDPWENTKDDTWRKEEKSNWQDYLQTIRNLQFFNDLLDNPEQKRLFEFDSEADPNDRYQVRTIREALARGMAGEAVARGQAA